MWLPKSARTSRTEIAPTLKTADSGTLRVVVPRHPSFKLVLDQ
jgi:hypothetical protein